MGNKSSKQNSPLKEEIPNNIKIPTKNIKEEKAEISKNNPLDS